MRLVLEEAVVAPERAPCSGDYPVLGVEGPHLAAVQERMQLDLVDLRDDPSLIDEPLQMRPLEVRHADGGRQSLLAERDEPLPSLDVSILIGVRPVDEEQVDMVESQSVQAPPEGVRDEIGAVPFLVELRRHEEFGPVNPARPDGPADAGLVSVVLCSVYVAVAQLEGGEQRSLDLIVVHWPGAEADLWNARTAGQRQ